MKKVAGRLRLDLSQYYELATFAQFATDLDQSTKEKIERGKRIVEILKQEQYVPFKVENEVIVIYLAVSGELDDIPLDSVREFERDFLKFMDSEYKSISGEIAKKKEMSEDLEKKLVKAISEFKKVFAKTHILERQEDDKSEIN